MGTTEQSKKLAAKKARSAAQQRYSASDKGKEAKQRWRDANSKKDWVINTRWRAKQRAKRSGVDFELSTEYLYSITTDQCPVFGTPFLFSNNKNILPESPSIDRIDPAKGYVRGNVVVLSMKANLIKSAYGADDIFKVAAWLKRMEAI